MAQLVKCLGYTREELWLITRLYVEKNEFVLFCFVLRSRMNVLVILVLGRWKQRDPGTQWSGSLVDASQSRQRARLRSNKGRRQCPGKAVDGTLRKRKA